MKNHLVAPAIILAAALIAAAILIRERAPAIPSVQGPASAIAGADSILIPNSSDAGVIIGVVEGVLLVSPPPSSGKKETVRVPLERIAKVVGLDGDALATSQLRGGDVILIGEDLDATINGPNLIVTVIFRPPGGR